MRKISFILLLPFLFAGAKADLPIELDSLRSYYGLTAGLNFAGHSADFSELPGIPNCCPKFDGGAGFGFNIGAFMEIPWGEETLWGLKFSYNKLSANMESSQYQLVSIQNTLMSAKINHHLESGFSLFGLEPYIKYSALENINLSAGISFGFLAGREFSQSEELASPETGVFENGLRVRNEQSGEIPRASNVMASIIFGGEYNLPLNYNKTMFLSPGISYSLGLTDVAEDINWNYNTFKTHVSLKYSPLTTKEKIKIETDFEKDIDTIEFESEAISELIYKKGEEDIQTDTTFEGATLFISHYYGRKDTIIRPERNDLTAFIDAAPFDGIKEVDKGGIFVEERSFINFTPLLTYIFFDENSAEIPGRYKLISKEETERFRIHKLFNKETLETYYHALNIIGRRMKKNPGAKIKIIGCNSGSGEEKKNISLSRSRAGNVADYLTGAWGISPDRIRVMARNLPRNASNTKDPDALAENRRVEIHSSDWDIIKPIVTNDTAREVYAPQVRFRLKTDRPEKMRSWRLAAVQGGKILKEFSGEENLPGKIDWRINEDKGSIPRRPGEINYFLELENIKGKTFKSEIQSIPVELTNITKHAGAKITDKKTETFSLILFGFDRRRMSAENEKIIGFIKSRIQENSKIYIEGYTDRVGEKEYNQELSEKRAQSAARYFDLKNKTVRGFGEINPLYDNNLPEGRFYSRTVIVIVETPLK